MPCGNPVSHLRYGLGVLRQPYSRYCPSLERQYSHNSNSEAFKACTKCEAGRAKNQVAQASNSAETFTQGGQQAYIQLPNRLQVKGLAANCLCVGSSQEKCAEPHS